MRRCMVSFGFDGAGLDIVDRRRPCVHAIWRDRRVTKIVQFERGERRRSTTTTCWPRTPPTPAARGCGSTSSPPSTARSRAADGLLGGDLRPGRQAGVRPAADDLRRADGGRRHAAPRGLRRDAARRAPGGLAAGPRPAGEPAAGDRVRVLRPRSGVVGVHRGAGAPVRDHDGGRAARAPRRAGVGRARARASATTTVDLAGALERAAPDGLRADPLRGRPAPAGRADRRRPRRRDVPHDLTDARRSGPRPHHRRPDRAGRSRTLALQHALAADDLLLLRYVRRP